MTRFLRPLTLAVTACLLAATTSRAQTPQYTSFAGVKHTSEPDTGAVARALGASSADPKNVDKLITLGLAQTAIRQVREAIATFTTAITLEPTRAILYRHRGHRYVSLGEYDQALTDMNTGAKLDATIYGIWYHKGVAHFAKQQFAEAAQAFATGRPHAPSDNEFIGSTDWMWMSLARAGKAAEAEQVIRSIPDSIKIPADYAYGRRLRLYRGETAPDDVMQPGDTAGVQVSTLAFGIGNWYLVKTDTAKAKAWFARSVAGKGWPAFAYMISERELKRLK